MQLMARQHPAAIGQAKLQSLANQEATANGTTQLRAKSAGLP